MKESTVFFVLLVLVVGKAADLSIELPSALKICKRNDPELDKCIKDSMQNFIPSLRRKTFLHTYGLPPIDPFIFEFIAFNYSNSNFMSGTSTVKDAKTYGMTRGKVLRVKSDFKNDEMNVKAEMLFPKLYSTGFYTSNMTLSAFELKSKGQYNVTLKNVKVIWNIKGKLQKINGENYMKVYKFEVSPEAEEMRFSFSGLFADEALNRLVNEFINQNWRLIYKEVLPELKKQLEPVLFNFTEKFISKFPWRRLLL